MSRRIRIAALVAALGTAGCLPTLELKRPQVFTDQMVKQMQFGDACGLQRYFDRNPPRILILEERAVSPGSRTEAGRAKVLVRRGPQLTKLAELLDRYYRAVPGWLRRSDVTVTTDFLRRIPRPTKGKSQGAFGQDRGLVLIPTTAHITMASGEQKVEVAYHPCLGELIFGRRTYRMRRLVLAPPRRATPRPAPRPAPRPDPRPIPRPDPRPDPRAAPRPTPRPIPRPISRPTPRPDPPRPTLPPLPR